MEEELDRLRNVDVRTVDPETLVDIDGVIIRDDLPTEERIMDVVQQIGNPYCFRCGNVVVKIAYADTAVTFEDALEQFIRQRQLAEHTSLQKLQNQIFIC